MSNKAITWVTEHSPYRGGKYALHLMLADTASDPDHELWGRQQYFADKARIDRSRCCVYLKEMVDEGTLILVEDHSKRRKPNRYRMVLPEGAVKVFDCRTGAYAKNMPSFAERADAVGETCALPQHVEIDKDPSCALTQHGHVRSEHKDMCADATQNPSYDPSPSPRFKNARGNDTSTGSDEAAAYGDRARSNPVGSPPKISKTAGSKPARDKSNGELFESDGSTANAAVTPPNPPHDGSADGAAAEDQSLHPDVAAVIRALGKGVARHGGKAVKTTAWERPIDLLLRRGPTEWADPEPVPVAEVLTVIRWLFDAGTIKRGTFCWADQVQSGSSLRKYWIRLRSEAVGGPPQLTAVSSGGRQADQVRQEIEEVQRQWSAGEITPETLFPRQARLAREEAARRAQRSA